MKKVLIVTVLVLSLTVLYGCQKKNTTAAPVISASVTETGTVVDVTEKNTQSITVVPGDVIYVKLTGEAASGNQWTVVSPVSGDFVSLKDHVVVGLTDRAAKDKQFTDEWWIKVEKKGTFDLQFDYGRPNDKAKKSFKVSVVSQ